MSNEDARNAQKVLEYIAKELISGKTKEELVAQLVSVGVEQSDAEKVVSAVEMSIKDALSKEAKEANRLFLEGNRYYEDGKYEDALRCYGEARKLYEEKGLKGDIAGLDMNSALVMIAQDRLNDALTLLKQAREEYAKIGAQKGVATVDMNLGNIYYRIGKYDLAIMVYKDARKVFIEEEMFTYVGNIDRNIALSYTYLRKYDESLKYYNSARNVFDTNGNLLEVAMMDCGIAHIKERLGVLEEAKTRYIQAREIFKKNEREGSVADIDMALAVIYIKLGDYENAKKAYLSSKEIYEKKKAEECLADLEFNVGCAYSNCGKVSESVPLIESAGRRYLKLGRADMQASIELSLSNCAVSCGKLEDALKHAENAKSNSINNKNDAGVAYSNIQLGEIFLRMNEGKKALDSFSEAEKCASGSSSNSWHSMVWRAKWGIARAENMLGNYQNSFDAISSSIEYLLRLGNDAEDRPSKSEWEAIFKFAIETSHRLGKRDAAERFADMGGKDAKEYMSTLSWM